MSQDLPQMPDRGELTIDELRHQLDVELTKLMESEALSTDFKRGLQDIKNDNNSRITGSTNHSK